MNGHITKKTKIGVLMGGLSAEKDVSLLSGEAVFKALTGLGYRTVRVAADRSLAFRLKETGIEAVFNALHGRMGEDGVVQGLLELMGIPYTGSGITASAAAMDKALTKHLLTSAGILTPPYVVVKEPVAYGELLKQSGINLPYIVKPACEGSSIGISKVSAPRELAPALRKALKYDARVIVEKFIEGSDVTVAVFDDGVLGSMEVRVDSRFDRAFLDYEVKYTAGMETFLIPPSAPRAVVAAAEEAALDAHALLGCSFYSRVDFRVAAAGRAYLLEVNTLPGLTALSYLPKIAESKGISYDRLIEGIMQSASLKVKLG